MGCLLDAAVECDVVVRRGSWYSYADTNFAQGRLNGVEVLKEDADLAKRIENDVRAAMSLGAVAELPVEDGEAETPVEAEVEGDAPAIFE